jgi:hypothetical protein
MALQKFSFFNAKRAVLADLSDLDFVEDCGGKLCKYFLHIKSSFCGCLVFFKFLHFFGQGCFFASTNILFISYNNDLRLFIRVLLYFSEPAFETIDRFGVGEIIDQYNSNGVFIVSPGNGSK